ncbi:hypothetical protein [Maritalea mobilis]|nr:hypothetical protein [Maritalea mobilis]
MTLANKMTLVAVQLVGLFFSGYLVLVTYTNQKQVEENLQEFAIAEVERAVEIALPSYSDQMSSESRTERLGALSRQFGLDADAIDLTRRHLVSALLANALSAECKENCEFWVAASAMANNSMIKRIAELRVGQRTIQEFLLERYETSVIGLQTDLRRFGLVNVIALTLMIGLVVFRGLSNWRFATFSIVVTGYVAWATYDYVFGQNWALSILLQDWAAPGYKVGMIIFSCLCFDWLFLRGTVTQTIANIIGSALPA